MTPSLTLQVSVPSGRAHYIRGGVIHRPRGGTGSPGKGAFLEAPRGREDGFMLGRKDPLFIIDKVSGAFGPLWRRTLAADRSRIPSCRCEAPRKVGVLELTQGPDLELTNPLLADA